MPRNDYQKARSTETYYARILKGIAREVGKIVDAFGYIDAEKLPKLKDALHRYSEALEPWARYKVKTMLTMADKQDRRMWAKVTQNLAQGLREELQNTPVGDRFRELMAEQVKLIKSIPTKAAERVHELVVENMEQQGRAKEFEHFIKRSGKVAEARAALIARTEVARANSVLTQARAEHVGSEGYIWRTVKDTDVRHSHKKMEGKFVRWDSPPTLDNLTGHAGALPNCRCYAEPVIPKELLK